MNQGFYAVTQQEEGETILTQLYALNFTEDRPSAYRLERRFEGSISDLTDLHMIVSETETRLWVRDRKPACDRNGACVPR